MENQRVNGPELSEDTESTGPSFTSLMEDEACKWGLWTELQQINNFILCMTEASGFTGKLGAAENCIFRKFACLVF